MYNAANGQIKKLYNKIGNILKNGLTLEGINKKFGETETLKHIWLKAKAGKFLTLLGPSGCGKTTLLRIIAGLEIPDIGKVILGNQDITMMPAEKREINIVFQNYALFPHLNIFENIAFGLKARKFPKAIIKKRVEKKLEVLALQGFENRRPHQLSGGQKQRVALARALVNEPEVLLLDEPMSALDARLRAKVQVELRRLQQKLQKTFILVTHDQDEALVVSDHIAVMKEGRIIQTGAASEVYDNPKTEFVAEFLGAANLIKGEASGEGIKTEIGFLKLKKMPAWINGTVAIRPEWIKIRETMPSINGIKGKVAEIIYRGSEFDIRLQPCNLRVKTSAYRNFKQGDEIFIELAPEELAILDE